MKGVSVVVPVYNSRQYIGGCIRSVLRQTYMDWELILIDDGSSDGSSQICEKACAIDERIRFIRQEHKGVSAARNVGIGLSKGKYLFFLDSDDIIHPQLLESLYSLEENNHTVIATTGFHFAGEGRFNRPSNWKVETCNTQESFYLDNSNALNPSYLTNSKAWLCAIGGKMILREAVMQVRFDEMLSHSEDMWFVFQLLINGADVSVLGWNWYYYRRGEKSSSKLFSVETCRSRYKVEKNIRDYHIKHDRITYATKMENIILDDISQWRNMGKRKKDIQLTRYMEELIKMEKKGTFFLKLKGYKKIIFYLEYFHFHYQRIISEVMRRYIY